MEVDDDDRIATYLSSAGYVEVHSEIQMTQIATVKRRCI
jgi:hypothetical protein